MEIQRTRSAQRKGMLVVWSKPLNGRSMVHVLSSSLRSSPQLLYVSDAAVTVGSNGSRGLGREKCSPPMEEAARRWSADPQRGVDPELVSFTPRSPRPIPRPSRRVGDEQRPGVRDGHGELPPSMLGFSSWSMDESMGWEGVDYLYHRNLGLERPRIQAARFVGTDPNKLTWQPVRSQQTRAGRRIWFAWWSNSCLMLMSCT
jgi:hypothetical protein